MADRPPKQRVKFVMAFQEQEKREENFQNCGFLQDLIKEIKFQTT